MKYFLPEPIPKRKRWGLLVVLVAIVPIVMHTETVFAAEPSPALDWPPVTRVTRPWTYWWWMGSAVSKAELTRHLEAYRKADMGGCHIVPIYGAKGHEADTIDYLTPKWMEMLAHTVNEADRLGMGMDMTVGTGWPYGGPGVGPEDAAAKVHFETHALQAGKRLEQPLRCKEQPKATLQTLMAFSSTGQCRNITENVQDDRSLDWTPPDGTWTLYAVYQGWTGQQVKRAAPGAEGNVLDYFSADSLKHYLARFDQAFADSGAPAPRSFYNDSYEVHGANWTDDLFTQFQARRGYDLRVHLPALFGNESSETTARVRADYRETVSGLLLEAFTQPWVAWSHGKGAATRNQAHGSPGNLLDLYAAADIPETEGFGRGGAEILVSKFASSAAHITNKRLVSAESCTWLGEHFQVSLAQAKPAIDQFFLGGVNHIFYHGMTYSPANVPYPGWLFYASTNFGLSNSFWPHLSGLNRYIARCQSFLQAGKPDPDCLLYFPIYDLWHAEHGSKNLLHFLQVHNAGPWFGENLAPMYNAAKTLWDRGYTFDYVSDRLLADRITATAGNLQAGRVTYRTLILPESRHIPIETLKRILALANDGATVIVLDALPSDVPGLADLASRREKLEKLLAAVQPASTNRPGIKQAELGRGRLLFGSDLEDLLRFASVIREPLTDHGLEFNRRTDAKYVHYFITNPTDQAIDDWVPLRTRGKAVVIFDPIGATQGLADLRPAGDDTTHVRLQLQPGESRILRVLDHTITGPAWPYITPAGKPVEIQGTWKVRFVEGGPTLPASFTTKALGSWTEIGPKEARAFSGTARYTITFERPRGHADVGYLDLGQVRESAEIKLNGRKLPVLWCRPFRAFVPPGLLRTTNELEIYVTNLMANRIADMDRRKIPWQKYFFVNIRYRPFTAADWPPMPSGLLGPVRWIPCTTSAKTASP